LPVITGARTLMMQMSINLSDLDDIKNVESGGSMIQTPIVQARNFLQRLRMKSSETLVIAGFQQDVANMTNSGSFSPWDWIFGGRREATKNNQVIVILVTPSIYR
jgi:type II secretory pathway component GspD/PulD (secretin)